MAKTKLRTPEAARAEFIRLGISVRSWALEHDLAPSIVHRVLRGGQPCRFGKTHKAAVLLGIKEGVVTE